MHGCLRGLVPLFEERVAVQAGEGDDVVQLAAELLGEHSQDAQGGLLDLVLGARGCVLRVAQDAEDQRLRHVVLVQVAAQKPELLGGLALHVAQLHHLVSHAACEGDEHDHAKDQHADRVGALGAVLRLRGHGAQRKVPHGPMHRSDVAVVERPSCQLVVVNPIGSPLLFVQQTECPPSRANEVVHAKQDNDILDDGQHQKHDLRLDLVLGQRHQPPQLAKPEQADDAGNPQHAQEPANISCVIIAYMRPSKANEAEGPIEADNQEVWDQPRQQVVLGNPGRAHHGDALRHVPSQEGGHYVCCPEKECDNVHDSKERAVKRIKRTHG
mmetsp:Transcript_94271/g.262341  ORF Transcript_94271/g.262341 Transcript_94271/m.262341 type:complete len:327 (+) Transcript_94271:127-1107(+)